MAILAIDDAEVRDFASCRSPHRKRWRIYLETAHMICAQSPFLDSIKFPVRKNIGLPEFQDYEIVDGPVIPPEMIVRWCIDRMSEYAVMKITMDTYRYTLFKEIFETYEYRRRQSRIHTDSFG